MLAKILVGVLAAVMVSGGGVYFAFCDSSCDHGGCTGTSDITVTEGSCCAKTAKTCCDSHEESECTESKACSADAAGAFVGGAALTAKTGSKKACCDE